MEGAGARARFIIVLLANRRRQRTSGVDDESSSIRLLRRGERGPANVRRTSGLPQRECERSQNGVKGYAPRAGNQWVAGQRTFTERFTGGTPNVSGISVSNFEPRASSTTQKTSFVRTIESFSVRSGG